MRKILLRIIRELNPTIFLIEKLSFSLKLLSGFFYGQSFIKTVRGPLHKPLSRLGAEVHCDMK